MSGAATHLQRQFDDAPQQREAATLGMWVFLSTEILFFGVLFAGYTFSRVRYPEGFAAASRHTDVMLGSIETAALLISSCLAALAVRDVQLGGRRTACWLLSATAALGITFLVLHGFEYVSEWHAGLVPGIRFTQQGAQVGAIELFFFLYYAITGFHGLHVMIGVVVILTMAMRTRQGKYDAHYHTPLEISALYWHLVDVIWIFVFPLMYLVGRAT